MMDEQSVNGNGTENAAEAQQTPPSEQAQGNDAVVAVVKELAEARRQADDYKDSYLRSMAEYQNLKRRTERQVADITSSANFNLLRKILPVVDDFQRALNAVPADLEAHPWLNGVRLIERKMNDILRSEGVETIVTDRQMFDPNLHEAVITEEVAGMPEGMIVGELQKGYRLGDRILRPAMVRVAK